jgi:hypothetical protein
MTKKTKAKALTFRQRLRVGATSRLEIHRNELVDQAAKIAGKLGVKTQDLLKYAAGGQIKTTEAALVTAIANAQEAELEALYNKQMDLPGVDND